jgi:hypothetical protein
MVKLVQQFNGWRIFQEHTHPLSENEAKGIFNLNEERERFAANHAL